MEVPSAKEDIMGDVNYYKLAPAHLYKEVTDGRDNVPNKLVVGDRVLEGRTFRTQDEVDRAWEEGWFGPPTLEPMSDLLSKQDWDTKAQMIMAVENDPRYVGLELPNPKKSTTQEILDMISSFEEENSERF